MKPNNSQEKNFCEVFDWTIATLMGAFDENPPLKKKIEVPKYQRNLVWKNKQKELFIESLKNGFPIGALLLYKKNIDQYGNEVYILVDGLQRSTTLLNYHERPTEFFSREDIPEAFLTNLANSLEIDDNMQSKLVNSIVSWVRGLKGFEENKGYSSFHLANHLLKIFGIQHNNNSVMSEIHEIIVPFKEKVEIESDLSKIKIPVVIYHGTEDTLPTIFERLNSKGTQLNKYQIYAATWMIYNPINITNREIINLIKAKYDSLIDEGLEIENYEPDSQDFFTGKFTVFEYIFGLSKYLMKNFPHLFGTYKKEDSADSIGFNLGAICLGLSIKEMDDLPRKVIGLNQLKFEEALFDSINEVYACLKPYIGIKANQRQGTRTRQTIYHSEFQIISLIGKIFRMKYDHNFNQRVDWEKNKVKVLNNIPYRYLYDIIRDYWRGSGDTKINDLIVDGSLYEKEVTINNWESVLDEWLESELQKKEQKRIKITPKAILFLKYIYSHLITVYQETSKTEFEIEHLVPVSRLMEIAEVNDGLPISAISNLCLIEKSINKEKTNKTIYEYYDEKVRNGDLTPEQASREISNIERYTFTKRSDLGFVTEIEITNYKEFLRRRFEKMKNAFYKENRI